jgi:hypothetical protein
MVVDNSLLLWFFVVFKNTGLSLLGCSVKHLSPLSADAASQLDILGHDGDTLGVDGSQVGVFEQANQVGLCSLLESQDGRGLETQVGLEVLSDLANQPLERQLADEQLGGLLVLADLAQSDSAGPVPVRLLYTASGGSALPGSLGGQLLTGSLATSGLTGSLLSTGHCSEGEGQFSRGGRVLDKT